jgi:hypothetical protein
MRLTTRIALLLAFVWPINTWANSYQTSFPASENPISENGNWINGGQMGLDWNDVLSISGVAAVGLQPGTGSGNAEYADATAVLSGSWASDQSCQATVYLNNANDPAWVGEEVELRIRTSITAHSITGYEILCSVSTDPRRTYLQIIRWNGPLGDFTPIGWANYKVKNGDVMSVVANGSTITAYVNGNVICSVNDSTFLNGSPGIGFWLWGQAGLNTDYGFSSFSASDSGGASANPTPTSTPYSDWESQLLSYMQSIGIRENQRSQVQSWMSSQPPVP